MPPPSDFTGVKSFLGAINFYRRFIPQCAHLGKPLTKLTCGKPKKTSFEWGPHQTRAFNLLKERIMSAPILQYPNIEKE